VAVHAHGATGARRALRAGADSIEYGTFLGIYDEQKARDAKFHPRVWEKLELDFQALEV
jgi:imidazolonepropionase-like amidohydrolase